VAAATAQWSLTEAPGQQQGQNEETEPCSECGDVQLGEQPVAASSSATAKWRVFTDLGRDLVQQGRLSEAERYFKKV
jgi:hypothetical protein